MLRSRYHFSFTMSYISQFSCGCRTTMPTIAGGKKWSNLYSFDNIEKNKFPNKHNYDTTNNQRDALFPDAG